MRTGLDALCVQNTLPMDEIKMHARRLQPDLWRNLRYMSIQAPMKQTLDDFIDHHNEQDPGGHRWKVVAIDIEHSNTNDTNDQVNAFSVILKQMTLSSLEVVPARDMPVFALDGKNGDTTDCESNGLPMIDTTELKI